MSQGKKIASSSDLQRIAETSARLLASKASLAELAAATEEAIEENQHITAAAINSLSEGDDVSARAILQLSSRIDTMARALMDIQAIIAAALNSLNTQKI